MLQALINKALSLDSSTNRHYSTLDGKNICILCSDNKFAPIYFCFEQNIVLFYSNIPNKVDLTITGTLLDFIQYAVFKDKSYIKLEGDSTLAITLEKLYLSLDIDWEEELAKRTHDVVAYQTLLWYRQLKKYCSNSYTSLRDMMVEYVQEETKTLPTQPEIDNFLHEVDELRLRVDRLNARINEYENS